MATIRLSVVFDEKSETFADVMHELTKDLDVTFDETGCHDSGGWPEAEFGGPIGDLEILVHRYCGGRPDTDENFDFEQFQGLLTYIKE